MWFDSDFSFSKHVQNVCKDCFVQLRGFRNIRQFLTHDASVSIANAFVSSRLDYSTPIHILHYNTSQSLANFLNVPKFQPKIQKSTKQFGFSFAFDAPTV